MVSYLNTKLHRKAFKAKDNEEFYNEKFGKEIEWRESWATGLPNEAKETSRAESISEREVEGSSSMSRFCPGLSQPGTIIFALVTLLTESKKHKGPGLVRPLLGSSLSNSTR